MSKPHSFERIDTGGWSPDAEPRLADWPKANWHLPTGLGEFLEYIGVGDAAKDQQRQKMAEFMELPAAQAMPEHLHDALIADGLIDR